MEALAGRVGRLEARLDASQREISSLRSTLVSGTHPLPPRDEVASAAREVYRFIMQGDSSPLRRFVVGTSDGGVHYNSSVYARSCEAYLCNRKESEDDTAGVDEEAFVLVAQTRHCD